MWLPDSELVLMLLTIHFSQMELLPEHTIRENHRNKKLCLLKVHMIVFIWQLEVSLKKMELNHLFRLFQVLMVIWASLRQLVMILSSFSIIAGLI
jgi:hypothetical protein